MKERITKDNLFKPTKSRAETKADTTDRTARSILDAEAKRRRGKTAKLRNQRLSKFVENA